MTNLRVVSTPRELMTAMAAAEGPVTATARSEVPVQRLPPATRVEAAAGGLSSGKG
jgi:hypothetical protein